MFLIAVEEVHLIFKLVNLEFLSDLTRKDVKIFELK